MGYPYCSDTQITRDRGLIGGNQSLLFIHLHVLSSRTMPTEHILSLLISERDKLNRAIEALGAPMKRRGRPAKSGWTFTTPYSTHHEADVTSKPPKRRAFTPAQRKQQAARMNAFWAAKRKAAGKTAKAAPASAAKRKPMTAAQKKALSAKMKASWAKRKKAQD
jgi:hypothetical protein